MRKPNQGRKSHTSSTNNQEKEVANDAVIEGEDRLSNLPECILTDILSRLPTRDAVQTCVLSKQWEFKWTSIYNMEFNDMHSRGRGRTRKERFSYFVDRVLSHCSSTSLQKFYLSCCSTPTFNYDSKRIQTWITTALRRNAQILLIDTYSESTLLPSCTYSDSPSNGLKELIVLSALTIRVLDSALFSNLTKIDFNHVVLLGNSDKDNEDTSGGGPTMEDGGGQPVVLKLPFLEYLNMFYCEWRNVNAVKFEVPMLSSFKFEVPKLTGPNKMIMLVRRGYWIKDFAEEFVFTICAGSKLTDIKLIGNLLESYDFLSLSQVQNASIKLTCLPRDWIDAGIRFATTLKQMSSTLMFLELSGESLNALKYAAQIEKCVPLFGNLIHLKLETADYYCTNGEAVISFIKHAPVLQTLTVETVSEAENNMRYYDGLTTERDEIIPDCFHSHLKVVKFVSAYNCQKEEEYTNLIKFILGNARVLEQLQFINPLKRRSIPFSKIQELLLSYPRASSSAQILFI